jgi:hypothetical protein
MVGKHVGKSASKSKYRNILNILDIVIVNNVLTVPKKTLMLM